MKKAIFYPYKIGSKSAATLARELGTRRVFPDGNYHPKLRHVIVNWGNSEVPSWMSVAERKRIRFLNKPSAVAKAANKLSTFNVLSAAGVSTVPFTTSKELAMDWTEGAKVICRTLLNAHSGKGIVVAKDEDEVVDAPLYTKYVKKESEFRVHVFMGRVIDFVEKKKRSGYEDANPYIRNTENGWVFCREGIVLPESLASTSISAVNALGLDFGAVDIILGQDGETYVLEVNTAVGMEGTTIEKYKSAISALL